MESGQSRFFIVTLTGIQNIHVCAWKQCKAKKIINNLEENKQFRREQTNLNKTTLKETNFRS